MIGRDNNSSRVLESQKQLLKKENLKRVFENIIGRAYLKTIRLVSGAFHRLMGGNLEC